MPDGHARLARWLDPKNGGPGQRGFAALMTANGVPTSQATVFDWIRGRKRPEDPKLLVINDLTGIDPLAFKDLDEIKVMARILGVRVPRRRKAA